MSGAVRLIIAISICSFFLNDCFSQCGEEYWYRRIHQNDIYPCIGITNKKEAKAFLVSLLKREFERDSNSNTTGEIWSAKEYLDNHKCVHVRIDSQTVTCKVEEIIKKKNNYTLVNGKLKKCVVYIIQLQLLSDSLNSSYMRIISVPGRKDKLTNLQLIKKDSIYDFFLVSYFSIDHNRVMMEDGSVVTPVRGPRTYSCVLLNDIWIAELDMFFNYYKTPNLSGLYYRNFLTPCLP